ncbi:MAG: ECF transporter S component [Bacillota bacterium]|nr:ECF transporter S component [Bacillota bacterium]
MNSPVRRLAFGLTLVQMVRLAVLGAMAFALMFLAEVPLPPFPSFLKYDAGDVPAIFASLAMGPWGGALVELLKDGLYLLSGKSEFGWLGVLPNLLAGLALVTLTGLTARRFPTRWGAAAGMAGGAVAMAALLSALNYAWFLPVFYHLPSEAVAPMVVGTILPFNLVKAGISGALVLLLYPRLAPVVGVPVQDGRVLWSGSLLGVRHPR